MSGFSEKFVADAAHQQKMFRFAKRSELFAVPDDFQSFLLTNIRQFFEFDSGSGVDVHRQLRNLNFIADWQTLFRVVWRVASQRKTANRE